MEVPRCKGTELALLKGTDDVLDTLSVCEGILELSSPPPAAFGWDLGLPSVEGQWGGDGDAALQ